jgi:hypothetical protein
MTPLLEAVLSKVSHRTSSHRANTVRIKSLTSRT